MLTETVEGYLKSRQAVTTSRSNVRIMIPPSVDSALSEVRYGIVDFLKKLGGDNLRERVKIAGKDLDVDAYGGFIPDSIIAYGVLSSIVEQDFTAKFNSTRNNPKASSSERLVLFIGCTDAMYAACSILDRGAQVRQLLSIPGANSQTNVDLLPTEPGYELFKSKFLGNMYVTSQLEDMKVFDKKTGIEIVLQLGREVGRVQDDRMNTDPTRGFISRFVRLGENIVAGTLPDLLRRIVDLPQ